MTAVEVTADQLRRGDVIEDAYGNPAVVMRVTWGTRGDFALWHRLSLMGTVGSDRGRPALAGRVLRRIEGGQAEWARNVVRQIKGWPIPATAAS